MVYNDLPNLTSLSSSTPLATQASTDALVSQLGVEMTEETTLDTLETRTTTYVFIGEDHYSTENKLPLASAIAELSNSGDITLYVESWGYSDAAADAVDELARDAGLDHTRQLLDESSTSLLKTLPRLAGRSVAGRFASRPEMVQGSLIVGPEGLLNLMWIARQCIDLRRARAVASFTAVGNVAEGVLGSCIITANRLVVDGLVDERLIDTIKTYLKDRLIGLRAAIDSQVRRPLLGALAEASLSRESPLMTALTACVFAPHIVSDAVFATRVFAIHTKPVVIVAGKAHINAIRSMLKVLDSHR